MSERGGGGGDRPWWCPHLADGRSSPLVCCSSVWQYATSGAPYGRVSWLLQCSGPWTPGQLQTLPAPPVTYPRSGSCSLRRPRLHLCLLWSSSDTSSSLLFSGQTASFPTSVRHMAPYRFVFHLGGRVTLHREYFCAVVAVRWARLVSGWVNVCGRALWRTSVCNQPHWASVWEQAQRVTEKASKCKTYHVQCPCVRLVPYGYPSRDRSVSWCLA